MSKVVPLIVKEFDFELTRGEWKTLNHWFVKPMDFWVKVKKRATGERSG